MDWQKVGKISYQLVLSTIEWGLKTCAVVAGTLALAANGSLRNKVGEGFGSLSEGLQALFTFPSVFKEMSWVAREFHQMGSAEFREAYGMAPIDQLINSLSGYFAFYHNISLNLSQDPFTSGVAAFLVFAGFYLLGRIIRFARQKGKGSYVSRLEQQLGDRIFNRRERLKEKVRAFTQQRSAEKSLGQSSPELT